MTKERLNYLYFDWIHWLIGDRSRYPKDYRKLLDKLHRIPFKYSVEMDGNREADGIELRYIYGYEFRYDESMIADYLDRTPCSVLEMMAALCQRCETSIMDGYPLDILPKGCTFSEWLFGKMLDNLGIGDMDDTNFDEEYVEEVVNNFLDRNYKPNGEGGLFILDNPPRDLRGVEIWYQMCWYIDEILGKEV